MTITQKWDGDVAPLLREMEKLRQQNVRLQEQIAKVAQESKEQNRNLQDQNKKTDESYDMLTKRVGAFLGTLAGVHELVSRGKQAWDEYNQKLKESAELAITVAESQSNALKNLAGLTTLQKTGLLDQIPDISLQTRFADTSKLVDAVGAAYSAGAGIEGSRRAVEAAARLTFLSPDQLGVYTGAAVDIGNAVASADAEKNLAFMLRVGANARITDPSQLASTLPPVVFGAASTAQNKELAAQQAGAIFAELTKVSTDVEGRRSTTAAMQFIGRMEEFFAGRDLDDKIAAQQSRLSDATKLSQRTEIQAEIDRLTAFQSKLASTGSLPFEQLAALASDQDLSKAFYSESFGEERFKKAFRMMTDTSSSLWKAVHATAPTLTFDPSEYWQQVTELGGATPQLAISSFGSEADAIVNRMRSNPTEALKGQLRETLGKVFAETRSAWWVSNITQSWDEGLGLPFARISAAGSPDEAFAAARRTILRRLGDLYGTGGFIPDNIQSLEGFDISAADAPKADALRALYGRVESLQSRFGQAGAEERTALLDAFQQMNSSLESIKQNTATTANKPGGLPGGNEPD